MPGTALPVDLSTPGDPRRNWKVVYPLPEIMLPILCAILAVAEDFVEPLRPVRRSRAGRQDGPCAPPRR